MNMLPINPEWKRRIKWADKQRKQQEMAVNRKEKKQAAGGVCFVQEGSR